MKTFPCIRGKIGDWTFYNTTIRMAELVNYVKFAGEIFPRNDLDQVIQRELTARSQQISKYLLTNSQRFMGSLIVAAVGGEPKFAPISFGESIYSYSEGKLGFLSSDGSEVYYALDGQHRLAAIKSALEQDPERLSKDEVALIIIWHDNNMEGKTRARRLFTTLNRYAKKTSKTEDLLFDEDNPVDIYTRRLVREHSFFSRRTKVLNYDSQGEYRLTHSESLRANDHHDKKFLFSLLTLRRCNQLLLDKWQIENDIQQQVLPDFEVLESGYELLVSKWERLLEHVHPWRALRDNGESNLDAFRIPKGGHPLSRPIAIIAFIDAVAPLLDGLDLNILNKVSRYLCDIAVPPFLGLLWKEGAGGMYDGQARRKAAACLYAYYLGGQNDIEEVKRKLEGATGRMGTILPERDIVLR